MNISVIRTTACTTTYRVDHDIVRLWIITGGTPCIDFDYGGLSLRFPVIAMWDNRHWLGNRYRHQDPRNIVGPKAEDVLPNGLQDLEDWYKVNKPLKDLRDSRYQKLWDLMGGNRDSFPTLLRPGAAIATSVRLGNSTTATSSARSTAIQSIPATIRWNTPLPSGETLRRS